eukprot:767577-Hanusia_phi.AAC.10
MGNANKLLTLVLNSLIWDQHASLQVKNARGSLHGRRAGGRAGGRAAQKAGRRAGRGSESFDSDERAGERFSTHVSHRICYVRRGCEAFDCLTAMANLTCEVQVRRRECSSKSQRQST